MEFFKEFMEDYNTATLPHAKYYNYEAWEALDYEKQKVFGDSRTCSPAVDLVHRARAGLLCVLASTAQCGPSPFLPFWLIPGGRGEEAEADEDSVRRRR